MRKQKLSLFSKREIRNEIRRLIKVHKGDVFNHIDGRAIVADLAQFQPRFEAEKLADKQKHGWASQIWGQYDRAHRPNLRDDKSGQLIPGDGLLPLGRHVRVMLSDASDDDVRRCLTLLLDQAAKNIAGSNKHIGSLNGHLQDKIGSPEYRACQTFGDYWKAKFGWTVPTPEEEEIADELRDEGDDDDEGGEE